MLEAVYDVMRGVLLADARGPQAFCKHRERMEFLHAGLRERDAVRLQQGPPQLSGAFSRKFILRSRLTSKRAFPSIAMLIQVILRTMIDDLVFRKAFMTRGLEDSRTLSIEESRKE